MANFSPDELREVLSLTTSIGRVMDQLSQKADGRNKKLREELTTLKSITSTLRSEEDIQKALEDLEKRKGVILRTNYGINQSLKSDLLKMADVAKDSLNMELRRIQVTRKVAEAASKVGESMKDSLSSLKTEIENIPVLGEVLSKLIPSDKINEAINGMTSNFIRGFSLMFKRGLNQKKGFLTSFGMGMRAGFGSIGRALGPLLANPIGAAVAATLALMAVGVLAFYKISEAAAEFRKETGLLNSQTQGLETQINNVYKETARLGASMGDIAGAAATFTNEFEGLERPSDSVLKSMVVLNKNFGVSVENAAKLNKLFQTMGGYNANQAQSAIDTTVQMAAQAKVAPSKVIEDMANSSEAAYKFFGGSVEELRKAAVVAARMGTSIQRMSDTANTLLDFETSINDELQLGAMLGANINFNEARRLFANKDLIGGQQAVIDQLEQIGDITKLNIWEQEQLVQATGMELAEITRQQDIRKKFGRLDSERLASALAFMEAGKDINSITQEDLDKQTELSAKQREMQNSFTDMKNELSAAFQPLLQSLMPLGKFVVAIIVPMFSIMRGFFSIIGKSLDRVTESFGMISKLTSEIFGGDSSKIFLQTLEFIGEYLGRGIAGMFNILARAIEGAAKMLKGFQDISLGIINLDFSRIIDGFKGLFIGFLEFLVSPITGIIDTFSDLFTSVESLIKSIAGSIREKLEGMLPDWVKNLFSTGTSVNSSMNNTGLQDGGSIDDGIVQGGKIITTNPQDTLIATKEPESLFSNSLIGGIGALLGGIISPGTASNKNDELIAEIKALRADLNSGKIAVYMDGKKVTASVSRVVDKVGTNSYGLV